MHLQPESDGKVAVEREASYEIPGYCPGKWVILALAGIGLPKNMGGAASCAWLAAGFPGELACNIEIEFSLLIEP